jgi:alkylated DNA repair protein alkB homolog 1
VLIPAALSPDTQKELVRASLEEYSRCNETNLHAHYLIPSSGLWDLFIKGDLQRISPKSSQHISGSPCHTDNKGPRQLIENEAASAENIAKIASEPKFDPFPSSSATPSSAAQLLSRLRWANLGHHYHWETKSYDFSKSSSPMPPILRNLCKSLVCGIDWNEVWASHNEEEKAGLSCENWYTWDKTYGMYGSLNPDIL